MRIAGLALMLAAAAKPNGNGQEQRLYHLIERQNQISTLLTSGKLAYDAGDYATAAEKWDALLRLPNVPQDVESAIRPMAAQAHKLAGTAAEVPAEQKPVAEEPPKPVNVTVSGTIAGGGSIGPGGAVIALKRIDGFMPRTVPVTRPMFQKDKRFSPHVLAMTVGSTVTFRNQDDIFHNVFSLGTAAAFDTGLHKGGDDVAVKLEKPGVVELLCNIHANMLGYLVVVDTPFYAVSDGAGAFQIKDVPPGQYEATVWHETASNIEKKKVTVAEGTQLAFTVATDKRPNPFPPDKYGKPRQQQLGY
jgi:hypothetical protein